MTDQPAENWERPKLGGLKMTDKPAEDWGTPINPKDLTPEQIIEWLEGMRELMFEVWRNNPELRKEWERLNN